MRAMPLPMISRRHLRLRRAYADIRQHADTRALITRCRLLRYALMPLISRALRAPDICSRRACYMMTLWQRDGLPITRARLRHC